MHGKKLPAQSGHLRGGTAGVKKVTFPPSILRKDREFKEQLTTRTPTVSAAKVQRTNVVAAQPNSSLSKKPVVSTTCTRTAENTSQSFPLTHFSYEKRVIEEPKPSYVENLKACIREGTKNLAGYVRGRIKNIATILQDDKDYVPDPPVIETHDAIDVSPCEG